MKYIYFNKKKQIKQIIVYLDNKYQKPLAKTEQP